MLIESYDLTIEVSRHSADELRLKILKIYTRERFLDMKLPGFAIQPHAVPVIDTIRRIRVLLDFKNDQSSANRVNAPTRQEHGIALPDRDSMKAFAHAAATDALFELRPCYASFKPNIKFRAGIGVGDVPHFGFRIAAQLAGFGCGRMHLERKLFSRIQNLDEQRKRARQPGRIPPEKTLSLMLHQPSKVLSGERPV